MSEPSKGTVSTLSICSVPGGFIVSWQELDKTQPGYASLQQAMQGAAMATRTVQRVCSGMPALTELLGKLLMVHP